VASSSFSACSQDDEALSWIPKSSKDREAEAVSKVMIIVGGMVLHLHLMVLIVVVVVVMV